MPRIYGSGTRPGVPLYNSYHVRWRPYSGETFSSKAQNPAPEGCGRRARHPTRLSLSKLSNYRPNLPCPVSMAAAPTRTIRCILLTMCGGALTLGKLFYQRPTQNPPPDGFGRRARRPAHASLSKLSKYRPNLLCPHLWLGPIYNSWSGHFCRCAHHTDPSSLAYGSMSAPCVGTLAPRCDADSPIRCGYLLICCFRCNPRLLHGGRYGGCPTPPHGAEPFPRSHATRESYCRT